LRRRRAYNLVALHRAVVSLRSPIRQKVAHFVTLGRFPVLISAAGVACNEVLKKMIHHAFFRIVAKQKPAGDNGRQYDGNQSVFSRVRFVLRLNGCVKECHPGSPASRLDTEIVTKFPAPKKLRESACCWDSDGNIEKRNYASSAPPAPSGSSI